MTQAALNYRNFNTEFYRHTVIRNLLKGANIFPFILSTNHQMFVSIARNSTIFILFILLMRRHKQQKWTNRSPFRCDTMYLFFNFRNQLLRKIKSVMKIIFIVFIPFAKCAQIYTEIYRKNIISDDCGNCFTATRW